MAAIRSGSPSAPSLIFRSGRAPAFRAALAIASGVPSEIVKAVVSGMRRREARPSRGPAWPARFAARSQNAQSRALRAAPGGMTRCRSSRVIPSATVPTRVRALPQRRHGLSLVAGIGNALATPQQPILRKFRDHDPGLGLGASADGKMSRDGPGFDADGEPGPGRVNHVFKALLTSLDTRRRSVKYVMEMRFFSRWRKGRQCGRPRSLLPGAVRGLWDGECDEF